MVIDAWSRLTIEWSTYPSTSARATAGGASVGSAASPASAR